MSYIVTNLLLIALATAASLIIGFVWLRAFGGAVADGLTPVYTVVAILAEFWLAAIMAGALILAPPPAGQWTMTIMTPIVIWIGFVVSALATTLSHRSHGAGAVFADFGLWLGTMVLQAVVMGLVGLVPPQLVQ